VNMLHIRMTDGFIDAIGKRLEEAIKSHKFGLLGVIDLQAKMKEKGVEFAIPCRIYEVCNPQIARQVLAKEMAIAAALPCRIALYQEGNKVKVATMLPSQTLSLFNVPELSAVAQEVEQAILAMMSDAVSA
jgi:uncharacterized protein (DUF302 family)